MTTHLDALVTLGMTPLEAAVYACLLEQPSSTGYAVARAVGKPTANTYKALAALEAQGAVTAAGEGKRLYRAVPPGELMEALERRFHESRAAAEKGLARLEVAQHDDAIHELRTPEQVTARLCHMLGRCRSSAVLDASLDVIEDAADDLAAAAALGAAVLARAYAPVEIEGVTCVVAADPPPGAALVHAVVDCGELLLATLDPADRRVRSAIYTRRVDLVASVHRALVADVFMADMGARLSRGLSIDELEDAFDIYTRLRRVPDGRSAG